MEVSHQLAILISLKLHELGYDRNIFVLDSRFNQFTKQELEMITELKVREEDDLSGIEYLTNLKRLYIKSINYTDFISGNSVYYNAHINQIEDFSFISKLKSLELLHIENDVNIRNLDVSELENLRELYLIHNPNLTELIGIEQLEKLEKVMIYGNKINNELDIVKYMENTIATIPNILDVNMYENIIKRNRKIGKTISDYSLLGRTKLEFGEYIGFLKLSLVSPQSLYDMYMKLDVLFKKNNLYEASDEIKISFVWNYILRNVKLDREQLQKRNIQFQQMKQNNEDVPEYLVKNFVSLHNSYIAFHFKKANCEGIVNLMQFMFEMLGITSSNVHCIDLKYKNYMRPNHALIRILYKGNWYYCDPTIDTRNLNKYFMKTIDELEETHLFNDYEIAINEEKKYEKHNGTDFNGKTK